MTKKQAKALYYPSFGKLLSEIQHTVPVGKAILCDCDLCGCAGISTKTYAKVKEASVPTSPSI